MLTRMTGEESEPFTIVGPAVQDPVRSRRHLSPTALVLLGAVAAVALGVVAVAAWTVMGPVNHGFCTTASWQSAAATEAEALVPAGARDPYTDKHDCDDRGYVSVRFDVADTTAALNAMYALAPAQGWQVPAGQSTAGVPCFEKVVDGTLSAMTVGAMAPSTAGVEVHKGSCNRDGA